MASPRNLRLVPSPGEPTMPGVLHAQVNPRSGHVDVVADQLYRTVGTSDETRLAAAETAGAITLEAASQVLRDAHLAHRVDPDGLLIPADAWGSAHEKLLSLGWTIHLTD